MKRPSAFGRMSPTGVILRKSTLSLFPCREAAARLFTWLHLADQDLLERGCGRVPRSDRGGRDVLERLERHIAIDQSYMELRLHRNLSRRLAMRRGNLIENSSSILAGSSARCYALGTFGFASLPAESDTAIKQVMTEARANADLIGRRAGRSDRPLPGTSRGQGVDDYRTKRARLPAATRIDLLKRLDDHVRTRFPDVIDTDLVLGELAIEKALVTSEGARAYCFSPRAELVVVLSVEGLDGAVQLHTILGSFGEFEDQYELLASFETAVADLHEDLRRKAEGVFCDAGTHDVVIGSDVAGILAHEAIGHTCEADYVLAGSIAAGQIGQQVASEKVTLADQAGRGFDGAAGIAIHVDDEGTRCRDVTIIENGVLKGFLHNKSTALELGAEPTGNARAFTFSDEPLVRMRNTAILPGRDRLADMIGAIDEGYYFKRSSNGQADLTSEFMFGVTCGYEIRHGRLGRATRDTTISGVAFDVLRATTHVGDEFTWSVGGWCGKKTLIPVSMGGPAIKTRLNVGGR
jgi:TldD protein